jgi:hypothetical protein
MVRRGSANAVAGSRAKLKNSVKEGRGSAQGATRLATSEPARFLFGRFTVVVALLILTSTLAAEDRRDIPPATDRGDRVQNLPATPRPDGVGPIRRRPAFGGLPAGATYLIESSNLNFGRVTPGVPSELPEALLVRVFSDRPWVLELAPRGPLKSSASEVAPLSRLQWRSHSASYSPFSEAASARVASGGPTPPSGTVVRMDLRMRLSDEDPVGDYSCELGISLRGM